MDIHRFMDIHKSNVLPDLGMFDIVLEFSYRCYFFLHSLYNLTNLNTFQETI